MEGWYTMVDRLTLIVACLVVVSLYLVLLKRW